MVLPWSWPPNPQNLLARPPSLSVEFEGLQSHVTSHKKCQKCQYAYLCYDVCNSMCSVSFIFSICAYCIDIDNTAEYTNICPRKCTYPVVFSLILLCRLHISCSSHVGGANWLRPKVEHHRQPHKWLVIRCHLLICVVLLKMLTQLCCWVCLVRTKPFWVVKNLLWRLKQSWAPRLFCGLGWA